MAKRFEDLAFAKPEDFQKSIKGLLMTCGTRVIEGITRGIAEKTTPSGSSQKRNAPSTIKRKKHDHPLVGGDPESPLLGKPETYRKDYGESSHAVEVRLKPVRADVGVYVSRMGYYFFDFTPWSVAQMDKLVQQYCAQWARKITLNRSGGGA